MMNKFVLFALLGVLYSTSAFAQVQEGEKDSIALSVNLGEVLIYSEEDKEVIREETIQERYGTEVSRLLGEQSSIVFTELGQRNEGVVYLRGFDLRGVPVLLDGIPVYLPYDGYVDLNRFLNAGLSKIEIAKGNASVLFGPNTMGGAINLISRQPKEAFELEAQTGIMSGKGRSAGLYLGSQWKGFFAQVDLSLLSRDFIPLSSSYIPSDLEKDHQLDNSWRKDLKSSAKVGYLGKKGGQYSLQYQYQHGEKGNPVYLGNDPNIRVRYWTWPYWDKESIYFIGKTPTGAYSFIKTRLYLDRFKNRLESYDDASFRSQNAKYAFTSLYKDRVWGTKLEWNRSLGSRHFLKTAFQVKNDEHRENKLEEPIRYFGDLTYTFGFEDLFQLNEYFRLIPGMAYFYRQGIRADNYDPNTGFIDGFPLANNGVFNFQMAGQWQRFERFRMSFVLASRSRLATMKDRYSYKIGRAIPNPSLGAEQSLNFDWSVNWHWDERIDLRSALYLSKLNNTIQLVDQVEPGISQMQNTGKALFYGLDVALSMRWTDKIHWESNYAFIKRKNLSDPDLYFIDVPKHKIHSAVKVKILDKLNTSISYEFQADRYSTSYGTKAAAFHLFNVEVQTTIFQGLDLFAGIENLFDTNYERNEGYPGAGRSFFLRLNYRMQGLKK